MLTSSHCIAVVSLCAMKTEVRLFDRDFNAVKISASVVLSNALVASSHNLKTSSEIHVTEKKTNKKKMQLIFLLSILREEC
jgi:hypothetical protein